MAEWKRQRVVYDKRETADLAELGLAAIFLNRTNRSGIIRGGVIGGKSQSGEWSLDCRFNKAEIISRIKKIRRFSDRIKIYQMDGLQFTKDVVSKLPKNSFAFYDPPYIEFSRLLYMNNYRPKDHQALAEAVMKLRRPWIVTYDCAAIREKLYQGRRRIVYGLHYTAHEKRQGQEVMYFSDKLSLPKTSELLAERMELVPYMSRLKLA